MTENRPGEFDVQLVRSARRRKTISARMVNWHTLEVRAPAHMSDAQLQPLIDDLIDKALKRRAKMRNYTSDEHLQSRAEHLNRSVFDGKLRWRSIRFVSNQQRRFGSCTPSRGTIRISSRLATVPAFVLDYVIVHELAHLLVANHSRAFWELVNRYPKTERARGYLMALDLEDDAIDNP